MPAGARRRSLLSKVIWTTGAFGASLLLRLGSNIVLARLLAPEIFGVMVIVTSMRLGIELLSDIGIEQNIVSNEDGLKHEFFNTAWTMQILRGAALSCLFMAVSPVLAAFYKIDVTVFLAVGVAPFLYGAASTSIFVMSKAVAVHRRNLFDLSVEVINFAVCVVLALITPTVWSFIGGMLISTAARAIVSYFLAHPPHKLMLDKHSFREIWRFGRWFMILSLAMYASTNLDKLYLGRVAPLALLGIYGIARTIADLPGFLVRRLSYQVVFPTLAAAWTKGDAAAIAEMAATRLKIVLLAAFAIAFGIATADIAVGIIYDPRYVQAGWMLAALLLGSWFSMLATLNEAYLLAAGRPAFNSATNVLRLAILAVGLPAGYHLAGFPGAIGAVILSEIGRYAFVGIGQHRLNLTFWKQDCGAMVFALAVVAAGLALRSAIGLGSPAAAWIAAAHATPLAATSLQHVR
jgi:O-antigen/teichoic acid export membrane protein